MVNPNSGAAPVTLTFEEHKALKNILRIIELAYENNHPEVAYLFENSLEDIFGTRMIKVEDEDEEDEDYYHANHVACVPPPSKIGIQTIAETFGVAEFTNGQIAEGVGTTAVANGQIAETFGTAEITNGQIAETFGVAEFTNGQIAETFGTAEITNGQIAGTFGVAEITKGVCHEDHMTTVKVDGKFMEGAQSRRELPEKEFDMMVVHRLNYKVRKKSGQPKN